MSITVNHNGKVYDVVLGHDMRATRIRVRAIDGRLLTIWHEGLVNPSPHVRTLCARANVPPADTPGRE